MRDLYPDAIKYAERGWSVMPISKKSKIPLVPWTELQTRQGTPEELEEWFSRRPNVNMGLVTGALSNVFVVETDSQEGIDWLVSQGLPPCPIVQSSQEYKRHFYFQHPGVPIKTSVSEIFVGIDVRGDGGQVVLPPSIHKSGAVYQWVVHFDEVEPPPAPGWLVELVRKKEFVPSATEPLPSLNGATGAMQKYANAAFEAELALVAHAPDGEKHAQLFKSVASVAEFIPQGLLSEGDVESMFFQAIAPRAEDKKGAQKTIRDAIKKGCQNPRHIKDNGRGGDIQLIRGKAAAAYIRGASKEEVSEAAEAHQEAAETDSSDPDEKAANNGYYGVQNGRTVLAVTKDKQDDKGSQTNSVRSFCWDGAAHIVREIHTEDAITTAEIEGLTNTGYRFRFPMEAAKFADPKAVAAALYNNSGSTCVIYAGMEKHLAPSIRSFTDRSKVEHIRLFRRVGWTRDHTEFIIPGLEQSDVVIQLDKELPYRVVPPAPGTTRLTTDVETAFGALMRSHKPLLTTMAVTHALVAPLAAVVGWQNDKFALFVAGRTGSFKTSVMQMMLCLYGDFSNEDRLLKFGMGGTTNAMMSYTADAADVPLLIDNFKPGTGNGQKDAQTLIHGVIEGGEKKRLRQDGTRRPGKEIHCWPALTGEDVIDDAASVARMLVVSASWDGDADNPELSKVQSLAHLLPAVGGAWLSWLMTDEARVVAEYVGTLFLPTRSRWASFLRKNRPDMVNTNRVASSLAICECAWEAALGCSFLKPVLSEFTKQFHESLSEIALGMGAYTAQTHEANRYLNAIRALLISNRAFVLPRDQMPSADDRRVFLGWEGEEKPQGSDKTTEVLYLQPDVAFAEALKFLKDAGGLNGVGMNTIHKQLDQLHHLAATEKGRQQIKRSVGKLGKPRVLVLRRDSVFEDN